MRTRFFAIAALVSASTLAVNAQQQPPEQQRPPQQQRPTITGDQTARPSQPANNQAVTVIGCLKAEKDVPGRRPAIERATTEDYVLTNVTMAQGSQTAGLGLASTLDIKGLAASELQKHLNHQVEITGSLTQGSMQGERGAAPVTNPGAERREGTPQSTANADLPDLQATSIKMLAATCPAP